MSPTLRHIQNAAGFIVLYVALDWMSLIDPSGPQGITPWNPPAGLTFALLLRQGLSYAPAVFTAVVVADYALHGLSETPLTIVASALTIAIGYGLTAEALRRLMGISTKLVTPADLLSLLGAAAFATGIVASAVVAIFADAEILPWSQYGEVAFRFWVGDLIGVAVVTPFLLLLPAGAPALAGGRALEYALQLAAVVVALWVIFGRESISHFEYSYVLFLPLVWIGLRDGLGGATWGIVATQLGLILAIQIKGFDTGVVTQFQMLMFTVAVTGLALGAVVDQRRRAEAAIKEHEAELAQAQRLSTSGEMAAALAHELNQPLTALISFARACQTMLKGIIHPQQPAAQELIDHTVSQAMRTADIISGARDFFRRGDHRLEPVSIPIVIAAALDIVRAMAVQNRVALETRVAAALPSALGDPIQIEQVIINLVRNSIEAVAHGAGDNRSVMISAARGEDRDFIEVTVQDSGPGFAPEILERLFTPFATTRASGAGLGLAICRSIVEAHGGRIRVASAGPGAQIRFTLPVYVDGPSA